MFLHENLERIEAACGNGLVLDVGGWGDPFPRADYVLDCFNYETRSLLYHGVGSLPDTCLYPAPRPGERFRPDTWVVHDICSPGPFPFPDKMFDFVVCSHTLEDVRDPIRVCAEMIRVGRAGYIETPSRLVEQTRGFGGQVGASHHRWLVEMGDAWIDFTMKSTHLHTRADCSIPIAFTHRLPTKSKVSFLFWNGSFDYTERMVEDPLEDAAMFVRTMNIPRSMLFREWLGVVKCRLTAIALYRRKKPERDLGLWTWTKLFRAAAPRKEGNTLRHGRSWRR